MEFVLEIVPGRDRSLFRTSVLIAAVALRAGTPVRSQYPCLAKGKGPSIGNRARGPGGKNGKRTPKRTISLETRPGLFPGAVGGFAAEAIQAACGAQL